MAASPGFTLIELMVSIVIVIALVALAFTIMNRVRAAAAKTASVSNLKALQVANGLYASDNNGRFVPTFSKDSGGKAGGIWDRNADFIDLYAGVNHPDSRTKELPVSPKHLDPIAYKARGSGFDTIKASYGMVSKISYTQSGPNTESSYRLGELTAPARTAAFVTAVNWLVQYSGRNGWQGVEGKVNAPMMAYRHRDKALVVYYDGHVGEISKKDMAALDRRGGQNNSFWKGVGGQR